MARPEGTRPVDHDLEDMMEYFKFAHLKDSKFRGTVSRGPSVRNAG